MIIEMGYGLESVCTAPMRPWVQSPIDIFADRDNKRTETANNRNKRKC